MEHFGLMTDRTRKEQRLCAGKREDNKRKERKLYFPDVEMKNRTGSIKNYLS